MILETYTEPYYTYELSESNQYLRVRSISSTSETQENIYKFMDKRIREEKAWIESIIEKLKQKLNVWDEIKGNHQAPIEICELKGRYNHRSLGFIKVSGFFIKSQGITTDRIYRKISLEEMMKIKEMTLNEIQRQFQWRAD